MCPNASKASYKSTKMYLQEHPKDLSAGHPEGLGSGSPPSYVEFIVSPFNLWCVWLVGQIYRGKIKKSS